MPRYQPHSIEEVQRRFVESLARHNSPINDASPGSALYALSRAISGLYAQYELLHGRLYLDSWFTTASGSALDDFALSIGLVRRPGTYSQGRALFTTKEGTYLLAPNTLLSDLTGEHFYQTLNQQTVVIGDIYEIAVDIRALKPTAAADKPAGSRLFINANTSVEVNVQVGGHRDATGACCGDLLGGSVQESDADLRRRIIDAINGRFSTTEDVVKNLVLGRLPSALVKVTTRIPGIVEVWLSANGLNDAQIAEVRAVLAQRLPAGILATVGILERVAVSLTIAVSSPNPTRFEDIYEELRGRIEAFLNALDNGQYFLLSELERFLNSSSTYQVRISAPNVIPVLQPNQMYQLGKLDITFNT